MCKQFEWEIKSQFDKSQKIIDLKLPFVLPWTWTETKSKVVSIKAMELKQLYFFDLIALGVITVRCNW